MVLSRGLVISLGVSALGCTLLFLYFRNKISSVERKVDVMFDLIQNHQQEQMSTMNALHSGSQQNAVQEEVPQTGAWTEDNLQPERNLIDVSDDEDDGDDSEEVSDSDDDSDEEEEQPTISLDKTEDMTLEVSEVKKINIQESEKVKVDETVELQEVEDVTDSLDEIDEDDDDEDEEEEEEDNEQNVSEGVKEVVISKLDEEFDYTKLKVSELKAMAESKNLEGYKSLKKGPLIELLKSNE